MPIGSEKANEVAIVTGSEMNSGWKFIMIDYSDIAVTALNY